MARSRRKNGGPTRGRFKLKKLGKGYSTLRLETQGNRPVLRVSEPVAAESGTAPSGAAKKG